ncbi:winged helix-turn-helix domain-containing protein [Bradyrhizobium diazoefficiens]
MLLALVRQAGNVVSKTELMATTWPGAAVEENSLRVHIAALRKALGDGNDGVRYLSTVSGQGYCFVAAVSRPEQRQPAPTNPTYVHNLPAHPRQMVGREQAIQDISERLRAQRFVTVVRPGRHRQDHSRHFRGPRPARGIRRPCPLCRSRRDRQRRSSAGDRRIFTWAASSIE